MVFHSLQLLRCGPLSPHVVDYSFHKSSYVLLPIFFLLTNFEYGRVLPSFCLTGTEVGIDDMLQPSCHCGFVRVTEEDVCISSRTVVQGMGS